MFLCLKCSQETKLSRNFVVNHLRKHRLSLQEYLDRFDTPANQTKLASVRLWVQKEEYLSKISGEENILSGSSENISIPEAGERRRSRSGSSPKPPEAPQEEGEEIKASEEKEEAELNSLNTVDQAEASLVETKLEPVEFNSEISLGVEVLPSCSSSSTEDTKTKLYLKPPMSPELMIAIAVRNLDPGKVVGASCSDIVAFLCLHFPYFTDNYLECKDMVRRECGMGSGFESGKENFQMRAEINCDERIHAYVRNNRDKISRSMLEPEFLDVIIERFVKEDSVVSPESRQTPPFNNSLLTYIALLKIHRKATLEQIVILLKFLFPALSR